MKMTRLELAALTAIGVLFAALGATVTLVAAAALRILGVI